MKREIIQGKIQGNERGYAFLIPSDDRDEDYFISHGELKGAMHGDTVLAETRTSFEGKRTTATVLKVLERGIKEIVGTYFTCRNGGRVIPDERKYFNDIFIPFGKGLRAKGGDKVVCRILSYPKRSIPEGIVTKVLGRQFEKKAELESIYHTFKLPKAFSLAVKDEAKSLDDNITKKDLEDRLDLRGLVTFTIDGEDAKDFDDAVSIEVLPSGDYKLGVHIADVSHYVTENSVIDDEAFERGTSVYFPEKVIPMLPERLCNDLCSLKEGVDRLTLSCIMTINSRGDVIDSLITPSVIRSRRRLTYNQVQDVLDKKTTLENNQKEIEKSLFIADKLCDVLLKKREENGSVDLDVKESAISIAPDGKVIVDRATQKKAHKIIEEFMIRANVTVAEYMYYLDKPFIYRVHGEPDPERVENFYSFLTGLGITVKKRKDQLFPKDFQIILEKAKDKPYSAVVNRVMLRAMQKAKYSPVDVGHFGLSEKHYCHFTSPIRRYPDLVIHRIIKEFLSTDSLREGYDDFVEVASKKSSEREKIAQEAERAVDDFYKLLWIGDYVGETFTGVISGVTGFGLFVELYNGVEGLIKIDSLSGKRYIFDDKKYTLSNGKETFRLGQTIKIKVVGVSISERRAEFIISKDNNSCKDE